MSKNELILLTQMLDEIQAERTTPLRDSDAFELFSCEQALFDRDLSLDEIAEGVLGGGNDGGIDGVYVFLNEQLVHEDTEVLQSNFSAKKTLNGARLEIWIVQAKTELSFSETAIQKVADSTRRLLDLAEDESELAELFSLELVKRTGWFRTALKKLASRHPTVESRFVYATKGDVASANSKVLLRLRDLENQLKLVKPGATAQAELLGAAELYTRANTIPSYTTQLTYQETATSGDSHLALVKLRDYMKFLSNEKGEIQRHIFDWNVRDYQGSVEVNREIRESLDDPSAPEFWWLNNGVTVVCSKASSVSKTYSLDNVQVVNGLQTSYTIHGLLEKASEDHPANERVVLVRILVTGDDLAIRDRVIRATNRQTSVPEASLRATDVVQRDIERYFLANGWFYDRRKNFYRNTGKDLERLVSIPFLAQAVMAMGLSRPNDSRARPTSLLKKNEVYKKVFGSANLKTYLWLAKSQKTVDAFLLSASDVTAQERSNLRFHVSMVAASRLVKTKIVAPGQLNTVVDDEISIEDSNLQECLEYVRTKFRDQRRTGADSDDRIAKGQPLVDALVGDTLTFTRPVDSGSTRQDSRTIAALP